MRTAIIGGGIAGLAAAYELEKARAAGTPLEYTLFEASPRLGGVLSSETVQGAVIERGPDSFLTEKAAGAELCREVGLSDALMTSDDAKRKTYVVVHNRLVQLPDGLMFMVPTKLIPTAMTRLFSPKTKLRMAMELMLPPRPSHADESIASLVERHFGAEVVDRLVDPLLSGIYGGDAAQLSAHTVMARMVEMESRYGSLTRGMLATRKQMRARAAQNGARSAPRPVFTTLRGGMQQLVDALTAHIDAASVRLSTAVKALEKTSSGWKVVAGEGSGFYDAVILASSAWAAAAMLGGVDPVLSAELASIPYSSSITVNLIYDEAKIGHLPDGFGFLVPTSEGRSILACTFVHRKFLGRTPKGLAVLRAFLGGVKNEALLAVSDEELLATVRRELSEILGTRVIAQTTEPEYAQVSRWRRAMAQYAVGHQARMTRVQARLQALPGLQLAGNAYDGIGIPDCIRLGRDAARDALTTSAHVPVH